MEQKEIAKRLIELKDIVDFLDDGCHEQDIHVLEIIAGKLYLRLSPNNQKKFQEWLQKKAREA